MSHSDEQIVSVGDQKPVHKLEQQISASVDLLDLLMQFDQKSTN